MCVYEYFMKVMLIILLFSSSVFISVFDSYPLTAGVAKGIITPDVSREPVGVFGNKMNKVGRDIYARVLVLNDGVQRIIIVTYDLNCLDVATPILRERLKKELNIPVENFIPLATHNHCAPIQIVPENFEYGRWLAEKIYQLIQEAINHEIGPVSLEFGFGYVYHLFSLGSAPVDYEVQELKVVKDDGIPVAILFNHPTHPLQIREQNNVIDTGHFGYAIEYVEEAFPDTMVLFADACGGNQFTKNMMHAPMPIVQKYGKELADEVIRIAIEKQKSIDGNIRSSFQVIPLSLSKPIPFDDVQRLAFFYPTDIGYIHYPAPERDTNWVRSLFKHYKEKIPFPQKTSDMICTDDEFLIENNPDGREFPCRFEESIVVKIGELIFVALQGEVCAPIGMRIKDTFRSEHPIMLFGYMGEHNLYIPTREIVRQDIYQARVIQEQYASPVKWSPTVEDEMVNAVQSQIKDILRNK
ncbi:MAG: hypothetical protein ACP5UA_06580 [Candidatus Hydrogenedens sp.]